MTPMTPEQAREKCKIYQATYRRRHPDQLKKSKRKYYQANRETILAKQKRKNENANGKV